MNIPDTTEELSQFLHCRRWMASGISSSNEISVPLLHILKRGYTRAVIRKRSEIRHCKEAELRWGDEQNRHLWK